MKQISSRSTWWSKRVFPTIWFGFLAFVMIVSLARPGGKDAPPILPFVAIPIGMAVFGFFLMKHLVWDLVDEVYDCGDSLLVKNRGEEDRIELSNIMNVSASQMMNPPRVTLRLRTPCRFGSEVSFSPVVRRTLNPFARNELVDELIVRVDAARGRQV